MQHMVEQLQMCWILGVNTEDLEGRWPLASDAGAVQCDVVRGKPSGRSGSLAVDCFKGSDGGQKHEE